MKKIFHPQEKQVLNLVLRLSSLGAKFLLTLYMGRFFELSAIGSYGLVLSAVIILSTFVGQEFSYIVRREIVGIPFSEALHKIRDQSVWYGLNFLAVGLLMVSAKAAGIIDVPTKYLVYTFALTVTEGLGAMSYSNMNLLNQQLWANMALFIRAAVWIPVVIVLGMVNPFFRNQDAILICWLGGSLSALLIPLWAWRGGGWIDTLKKPVNWSWMIAGVKKSVVLWLGAMCVMAGFYVDRYFVNHFLDINHVGVMTFYYSFVNAIYPLVESGVLSFLTPRLVDLHKRKDKVGFWRETRGAAWQVALGVGGMVLLLGVGVPVLCQFLEKKAFVDEIKTFWLLLAGGWITSMTSVCFYVLFAQHRDKPIWLGNMLFLLPVIIGNMMFLPSFGFIGVGITNIASATFLLAWRLWFSFKE